MTENKNDTPRALEGVRVLELGTTIAGPLCARLLADFGAEVIKVEAVEGDPIRLAGRHFEGESLYAKSLMRNKKLVAIDLRNAQGQDLVRRLAAQCDVVVENFRPGGLEKWGLGYEDLKRIKPDIVMVRVSGYGQDGPYSSRPGYGIVCEAIAGLRYINGEPGRPPVRTNMALTDYITGTYAAFGAMLALRHRDRKRVVDDEHADEEREHARHIHRNRVHRERRLELLPSRCRRLDVEPDTKLLLNGCPPILDGDAVVQLEIDAVEPTAPAEDQLCRVDVHDSQVAAERTGEPARSHDAAHREGAVADHRRQGEPIADGERVPRGEFVGDDDRVGLSEKDERIVDDRFVAAFEIVVAQAAVAGHVHAEYQDVALTGEVRSRRRLDDRNRNPDGRNGLNLLEHLFGKTRFAGADLQLRRPGDSIDRPFEGEEDGLVGRVHRDKHGHTQHDAHDGQ